MLTSAPVSTRKTSITVTVMRMKNHGVWPATLVAASDRPSATETDLTKFII